MDVIIYAYHDHIISMLSNEYQEALAFKAMRWRICDRIRIAGLAVLGMELPVSAGHRDRCFYGSA